MLRLRWGVAAWWRSGFGGLCEFSFLSLCFLRFLADEDREVGDGLG
jgi:hypothetical protein